MRESQIEEKIREYAILKGCLFRKFTSPGWVGVPDRIIITPAGCKVPVAFMELKKPRGDIAPKQFRICGDLNDRGVPSAIIDNVRSGIAFIDAILNYR